MHEFATLVGSNHNMVQELINDMVGNTYVPTSQSRPPMLEPTLYRISKIVMKEAGNKMLELIQSGKKIPENDVDVLDCINPSDLYGMINEGINKHYQCMFLPLPTVIPKQHMQNKKNQSPKV